MEKRGAVNGPTTSRVGETKTSSEGEQSVNDLRKGVLGRKGQGVRDVFEKNSQLYQLYVNEVF